MSLPLPPMVLERLGALVSPTTLQDGLVEVADTKMLPPTEGRDRPGTEITYRWQGKMTTAAAGGFRDFPVTRGDRLYVLLSNDVPILFMHAMSGFFSYPADSEAERLREELLDAIDPLDIEAMLKRFATDSGGPAAPVEKSRAWQEFSAGMVEVELSAEQKKRKKKRRFRVGALVGGVFLIALVVGFFQVQMSSTAGGPGGGALGPGGGGILGAILGPSKTAPTEFVDQIQFTLEEIRPAGAARCELVGHVHNRMARVLDRLEFVARVRDQDIVFQVVGYGKGEERRGVAFASHEGACQSNYKARYEVTDKTCDINGLPWKGGCRDFVRILF